MKKSTSKTLILSEKIAQRVIHLRGQKVMLDADLATLFGVQTKALNQAVKRNRERFPHDFMFHLTEKEKEEVVTNCDHLYRLKFSPVLPYAFTEYGALMLANVLNSPKAIQASIYIVRVFVKFREMISIHKTLAQKLDELERKIEKHDDEIQNILEAIRQLMVPPEKPRRRIGFHTD